MTTPERSMIRLRLLGGAYPDGEIPLANLALIADCAQRLATRLVRAEEGRGGPGRSPNRLAEGVRLMFVGIEPGTTQLLIAGPSGEPTLDLGHLGEEAIERAFGQIVDGLDAAASGHPLPDGYDDLSRRGLVDWIDALAQAAPEVEVEGRVGARQPKTVRMRPRDAMASLQGAPMPPPTSPTITVEGVLYAVNLHTGRYRIEDDMGSSIDLVASMFTSQQVAPLLGERVAAGGTAKYDDAGRIKELHATTLTAAAEIEGIDAAHFERAIELDELLADAEPLISIDELAIPDLTEEEIGAFVRSLGE
jgi:hypothetical protein